MNTIDKLTAFVNQRPGLDLADYGDSKSYNKESREITNDRNQYFELLAFAYGRVGMPELNDQLTEMLSNTGDRLALNSKGQIEYTEGQYFPTEYRPAACRALVSLIWRSFRDEKDEQGNDVYQDGNEIRKAISRNLSRGVIKNYFN